MEAIASGGMGDVYRARDPRLRRDVALKLPIGEPDAATRAAFEREMRAVAALSHPGILAIHDVSCEGPRCWAALELLEGETLRERLARGPIPWRAALDLGREMAEGLAAAHAHGIVHGDLKPANVFVTTEGHAKLLDFGLARTAARPGAGDETSPEPGLVAGTAGYMAPEQVRGGPADARSDVFSFGCVLYEMLAGVRAFAGATPGERLAAILTLEPEDPADRATLPDDLRQIVLKCLEKDPAARFLSAGDLAFALRLVGGDPRKSRTRRRVPVVAFGALGALAALLLAGRLARAPETRPSIAVLPFAHAPDDPQGAYLGEGIAEGLINALAPLPGLRVIARTTAFRYRDTPERAAGALRVASVLSGTVRRHGESLEVQADLVDATGAQLWGRRYTATLAGASAVPLEIAGAIAPVLHLSLSHDEVRRLALRPTSSGAAWDLHMRARHEWDLRTGEGLARSIALSEAALREDPRFAPAWAGLAEAWELLAYYGARPPRDVLPKARDAALRALEIDPGLAEADAVLADIRYQFEWDWKDAERGFLRALARNPNCATAHQWYSNFLSAAGRPAEATAQIEAARALDPLNLPIDTDVGLARYWSGDVEGAESRLLETLDLEPSFPLARLYLGLVRIRRGAWPGALEALAAAARGMPGEPDPLALEALALARSGRLLEARAARASLEALAGTRWVSAFPRAVAALATDDREQALALLERAADERAGRLVYLRVEPFFDPLRREPRFAAIVAKVGIPR